MHLRSYQQKNEILHFKAFAGHERDNLFSMNHSIATTLESHQGTLL
jgi:hypothetical protein